MQDYALKYTDHDYHYRPAPLAARHAVGQIRLRRTVVRRTH